MAEPLKHTTPTCYPTKFRRCRLSSFRAGGVQKFLGDAGALPAQDVGCLTPRNTLLPTCVIVPNSVTLGKTIRDNYYGYLPENFEPSHPAFQGYSRSLKPTQVDRLPVTSCYCSIVTTGPSCTISEMNGDICKNFPPPVFNAPTDGFPLEFCNGVRARKN